MKRATKHVSMRFVMRCSLGPPRRATKTSCGRLDFRFSGYDHSLTYRANALTTNKCARQAAQQPGQMETHNEQRARQRRRRTGDPAYRRRVVSSRASGVVSPPIERSEAAGRTALVAH